MKRVVVTGMGIVSSIGNNTQEVLASLHEAKSGISRADRNSRSRLPVPGAGRPTSTSKAMVDRRRDAFSRGVLRGTMSRWSRRSAMAASNSPTSSTSAPASSWDRAGPPPATIVEAADITRTKGPKRVGPFAVPKAMSSTASATLATWFKIKGVNYSISSACATSNHCIGNAARHPGRQAGHDLRRRLRGPRLDAVRPVRRDGRDVVEVQRPPATASRAYDKERDGFVIAGGAGVLVLEELEHAKARGANLWRTGRLWRDLRRSRHGLAPRARARCAACAWRCRTSTSRSTTSTRTPPRRPVGDRQGDRGAPRGVRRQVPADLGDQIADRPFARRHRRAGGDLLAC
jgi:3-oxoacyl-[acyl-carrier-protein] synthase-1